MHPALAARVHASVLGRRATGETGSPRGRAAVRFVLAIVIATVGAWIFNSVRTDNECVERERTLLLGIVHGHNARLNEHDRAAFTRDTTLVASLAGAYEGDLIASELTLPLGLTATLARPTVYVHAPIESLGTTTNVESAAFESLKDSLLLCLVDPPSARTEKAVLAKVRIAYGDGVALEHGTANVTRLADASSPLRVLSNAWEARVRAADSAALGKLHADLDRAPIESGIHALKAELLIVAIDEHAEVKGPAELDGERPHLVRLVIVDLLTGKVLLRMRKAVAPSDWSEGARIDHARGLDECAFAFDARAAVTVK
ncbi:hypothetical protein BH09MYX1_BH09MYX1_32950 [soil metagenome]